MRGNGLVHFVIDIIHLMALLACWRPVCVPEGVEDNAQGGTCSAILVDLIRFLGRYDNFGEFMGQMHSKGVLNHSAIVLEAYLKVLGALAVTEQGACSMNMQMQQDPQSVLTWTRMLDAMKQICSRYSLQSDRQVHSKSVVRFRMASACYGNDQLLCYSPAGYLSLEALRNLHMHVHVRR